MDSPLTNEEVLELYINDGELHVVVAIETNVTEGELSMVKMANYTVTNRSCREDTPRKGGGGGGALIYVHDSIAYLPGIDHLRTIKCELDFFSTELFPNYNYDQSIMVVGVYRPPDFRHPQYDTALKKMLGKRRAKNATAFITGDVYLNSWDREFTEWINGEELRALASPQTPTHRSGTVDDAMLVAVGAYVPKGSLPGAAESEKELGKAERFPVYVTEDPVIADHMALMLALNTQRPDVGTVKRKYNTRSVTPTEWAAGNCNLLAVRNSNLLDCYIPNVKVIWVIIVHSVSSTFVSKSRVHRRISSISSG